MDRVFDQFYQRHLSLVRAVALARTGDPTCADDLTQETLLRAWRSFDQLRERDDTYQRAWLLTTLRHRAVESWRRTKATTALPETLTAPEPHAALQLDVARALMRLQPEDRELVVLRYFEQLDSPEIGAILGQPEGTIRRRLAALRPVLAQALAAWRTER